MGKLTNAAGTWRFGVFEFDAQGVELRRAGVPVKLREQSSRILFYLLENAGRMVTREELRRHLWPSDTFVDFDHSLNTAVMKLREALGDSADKPLYIETIPKRGYRFVAPVLSEATAIQAEDEQLVSPPTPSAPPPRPAAKPAAPFPGQDPTASNGDQRSGPKALSPRRPSARLTPLRTAAIPVLLVVVLVLGALAWRNRFLGRAAQPQIKSLAVLPLDNLSGDPAQEYLADGMTDELITMLAKNSTLSITSRTSVMQYKRAHRPLREIAHELKVDGVLEGAIVRTGDKVHMTIQLIQAPSDTHLWAESYDRNANDIVSLPHEAAQTIAKRLSSVVPQPVPARFVRPEAHDAYLRGRYLWFLLRKVEAGKYFQRAIELQPDYALAWSSLADSYGGAAVIGMMAPEDSLPKEETAAVKAVQLDDSLPEAHLALGAAFFLNRWDWERADHEITRAIELNPSFAEAYHFRSKMRAALNRHQEAIEADKKASELDPLQRPFAMTLAYLNARQYDAAINDARDRLDTLPTDLSLHGLLGEAYRRKGQFKEAVQELENLQALTGDKAAAANIRLAFEQGGYPAVLRWQISDLTRQSSQNYVSPVDLAVLYAQLGRREETLSLLEEAARQHSPHVLWMQNDPAFDFLHSDERYRSLIRKIGLPPAY